MKRWLQNTSPVIMIIGNDSTQQAIITKALHNNGYHIIATNYADGANWAAEARPHLIIIDIVEPDLRDYEIWRQLKLDHDTRTIPVIFCADQIVTVVDPQKFSLTLVDYLIKPINPHELLFRVQKQLQHQFKESLFVEQQAQTAKDLENAQLQGQVAQTAKKMFLAHTSHELRTPLSTILGYAELLRSRAALNPQVTGFDNDLQKISESGYQLLDTIDTLLKISYLDRRTINLYCEDVHLSSLINEVFYTHKDQFESKGLNFHKPQIDPDMTIHTDGGLLKQVLSKLISNALKFTDTGNVKIKIRHKYSAEGQPKIDFEIHDTGVGIAPDKLETIFEAFALEDHSLTRSRSGLGLGLTLAKKIISALQGEIYAHSEVGKGSIFIFSLPSKLETPQKKKRTSLDIRLSICPSSKGKSARLTTK